MVLFFKGTLQNNDNDQIIISCNSLNILLYCQKRMYAKIPFIKSQKEKEKNRQN